MSAAVILVKVSVLSGLFPLLAAAWNYRALDPVLRLVAIFCLLAAIPDPIALLVHLRNSIFLMHLYDLMAVVFFTIIYHKAFHKKLFKNITLALGGISLLVVICNALFIEGLLVYPSISNTVLSLLLIPLSLGYFYELFTRQEFVHIEKQGMFWINAGVLFYFSILIFLFMLYNKISHADRNDYYMMQYVTNIIANLLYSVGLLCKPQKTA